MILRLGHVEICTSDMAAARAFYVDVLGFVEQACDGDALYVRGAEEFDAWSLKIRQGTGGGLVHSSFRVGDGDDLSRLERLHRDLGLAAERVAAGAEPGQGPALRCRTPDGHAIEFFHEFEEIDAYCDGRLSLPSRRSHRGVPPARLDHVSIRVADMEPAMEYWIGLLRFSASEIALDHADRPIIAWLRRQARSHDVALGRHEGPAFHHVAYAVADPSALLRAADILGDARLQGQLEFGPSRHGATNAFAMYIRDPDGNRLELYCGDYTRDLDRPPLTWKPADYAEQGHSWWGDEAPATFPDTKPLVLDGWPA